jgi:hypothetical protein
MGYQVVKKEIALVRKQRQENNILNNLKQPDRADNDKEFLGLPPLVTPGGPAVVSRQGGGPWFQHRHASPCK